MYVKICIISIKFLLIITYLIYMLQLFPLHCFMVCLKYSCKIINPISQAFNLGSLISICSVFINISMVLQLPTRKEYRINVTIVNFNIDFKRFGRERSFQPRRQPFPIKYRRKNLTIVLSLNVIYTFNPSLYYMFLLNVSWT